MVLHPKPSGLLDLLKQIGNVNTIKSLDHNDPDVLLQEYTLSIGLHNTLKKKSDTFQVFK